MSGISLYAAVFLAAFGEATVLIGLLVPGVGIVVGAGALAARGSGSLMGVALCASLGSIVGFGLSYHAGRAGSHRLERWSRRAPRAFEKSKAFLDRFGGWGVFLGHFFGPVRACIAFVAGAGHLSRRRFWTASILGSTTWGFGLAAAGAAVSGGWQLVEAALGRGSLILAAFVVLLYVALRISAGALALGLRVLPSTSGTLVAFLERHRELPWLSQVVPAHPHFLAWVQRRLSPDHATGLLLSTGAIACACFAWIFFGVLEGLLFHDPLIRFDLRLYHLLQTLRTPRGNWLFLMITYLGSGPVLAVAAVVGTAALLALRRRFDAGLLLLGFGSGELLTWALKHVVARPRPVALFPWALETSAAFPSNHAFSSVALFGFLAYAGSRGFLSEAAKARLFAWTGMTIVAMGASRLYLGAHWPSDVAAGYALGGIWLSALITAAEVKTRFSPSIPPPRHRTTVAWGAALLISVGATWGISAWHGISRDPGQPDSAVPARTVHREGIELELAKLASSPVEGLTGTAVGRIELFAGMEGAGLRTSLATGGWTPTEELHAPFVLRRWVDAISGSLPPESAAYPLFWRERPQSFAFAMPDKNAGRWVVRCWPTGLSLDSGEEIWALGVRRELPPTRFLGVPTPVPQPWGDPEGRVVSTLLRSAQLVRPATSSPFALLLPDKTVPAAQ